MKRIAICAAFLALFTSCRNNPSSWEETSEYAAFATLIDDLQKQRDSLFRVSDQLAPDTPAPEVSRLMDERFEVEGLIRELKKQRDEAEEKFYQRKGRRK